jgi:hypothetical protein
MNLLFNLGGPVPQYHYGGRQSRVAVVMDIHGDIHAIPARVRISYFEDVMDISMDIFQQFKVANLKFNSKLPHYAESDIIPTGIKTLLNVKKNVQTAYLLNVQ